MQDFENAKTGDIFACGSTHAAPIAKWMARGDSAHWIGLVWVLQCPIDCVGDASLEENIHVAGSHILKIGDICADSTATMSRIAEQMVR